MRGNFVDRLAINCLINNIYFCIDLDLLCRDMIISRANSAFFFILGAGSREKHTPNPRQCNKYAYMTNSDTLVLAKLNYDSAYVHFPLLQPVNYCGKMCISMHTVRVIVGKCSSPPELSTGP